MCGRFTQTKSRQEELETLGDIELPPLFQGRYNIAPTQTVAIVRQNDPHRATECIWGFRNPKSTSVIINARSKTLHERPLFKSLLTAHRCLIPADGFYEWKGKLPYYFQLLNKQLFAFAGLWRDDRCVILTRAANKSMQGIHDRMPVILEPADWQKWITIPSAVPCSIFDIQYSLIARPVSRRVNKVANDDVACINAADEQIDLSLFPDEQ